MGFKLEDLAKFPIESGVYIMKDVNGAVLYVGKAKNLKNRIKNYFTISGDNRAMIPFLLTEIEDIDTLVVPSEKDALLVENTLIKKHQPKYNALLKDDKTFIGLLITSHNLWPMLRLVRYKGKPTEKGLYFGPYVSAYAAREVYELLSRLFPLRQCSDEELKRRVRPCLLYSMKKCVAPCVGKCTKEEYDLFVNGAVRFLKGQNKEIVKTLEADMYKASNNLEYEKAAALHKTIRQIQEITQANQLVAKIKGIDADVLALHREGYEVALALLYWRDGKLMGSDYYLFHEIANDDGDLIASFILQHYTEHTELPKEILISCSLTAIHSLEEALEERIHKALKIHHPQKGDKQKLVAIAHANAQAYFHQKKNQRDITDRTLAELEEKLKLNRFPSRIECFDISNLAGKEMVGSMVAFTNGEKDKKRTRLFKIKEAKAGDDYGAMREVLSRRLLRAKDEMDLPDLIIVDGGKGQLNIALEVLKELDIASVDTIGLAKEDARHDKGLRAERVFLPHISDPISFDTHSPLLFFLQRIRDEAHRLAIGFHRKRRSKNLISSALEDLPGIGPIKQQRLLRHFGSVARIRAASKEELAEVQGLTEKDQVNLIAHFQKAQP